MSILDQLSSQVGDRTEGANRRVVARCLADPALLAEIDRGLSAGDAALVGDCAEVFTEVAREQPERVAPYVGSLAGLLGHKNTRVRWEATHALALAAPYAAERVGALLSQLGDLLRHDRSTIVRDYAVDALGNYAGSSPQAAEAAYPLLCEALGTWDGKQAGHALAGLAQVAGLLPARQDELQAIGQQYTDDARGVVRKAARRLLKVLQASSQSPSSP